MPIPKKRLKISEEDGNTYAFIIIDEEIIPTKKSYKEESMKRISMQEADEAHIERKINLNNK